MIDRASLLLADLARIPDVLRRQAGAASRGIGGPVAQIAAPGGRIVLTGLGSSRFAALAVAPPLRAAGFDVVVEHASTQQPAPLAPGSVLVAISSSGRTPETVAAAKRGQSVGVTVVAITNDPTSALAAASDIVLALEAGEEVSGVASLTYAATIAVLCRLAETLGSEMHAGAVLSESAEAVAERLGSRSRWLGSAADLFEAGAPIHVLADAAELGTAEQAALLFRECPRIPADATDAGDWLHIGIYTALPGSRAILLAGTPYDREIVDVFHARGGRIALIAGPRDETGDSVLPGLERRRQGPIVRALEQSVVLALVAAELWQRARADAS